MLRNTSVVLVLIIGALGLLSADAARAGMLLYGVEYGGDVISIDTKTGQGKLIGYSGYGGLNGAASDSKWRIFSGLADQLIEIDPETGAGSVYMNLTDRPPGYGPRAYAFDSQDHLYVILSKADTGAIDMLATIDMQTGAYSVVGDTGLKDLQGLAFDASDTLYGLGIYNGLCTIDTSTGAAKVIGGSGISPDDQALEFDMFDGTLYCARQNLKWLDTSTGNATLIGPTGFDDIRGLAGIPEPTTLALAALGGVLLIRRPRR